MRTNKPTEKISFHKSGLLAKSAAAQAIKNLQKKYGVKII